LEHSFNVEIANEYGILEAVLLKHLYFWIKKNEANNQNYYEGYYWTYNSIKAFGLLFPYSSEKKIRYALKRLEDEGIIITGNFNKSNYDRTQWYAFTEKGYSIMQNCQIDLTKSTNGDDHFVKPIPNINTDIKPNIKGIYKEKFMPPTLEVIRDYCLNVRHNNVDYQFFYYYFTEGEWIDSQGNKVKNWKQKIITWEKKGSSNSNNKNKVVYDSI
jgi:hypothetical protein